MGLYLLSACTVATFLWHPASPVQRYLPNDAIRRILMGLAMVATIMAIVLSPWGKQSGAHFILTSQMPIAHWHDVFGPAGLDRNQPRTAIEAGFAFLIVGICR
jgi:uncharacterized membrane protein YdcZ (DUF606 family)